MRLFKSMLIGVLLLISTSVFAQTPTYTLKVDAKQLEIIGKSLGSMPYSDVAELFQSLRQQVTEQQKPVAAPMPTTPAKPVDQNGTPIPD